MNETKQDILENHCYTELVYGRINKKLGVNFSNLETEDFIKKILEETHVSCFRKTGKNYYISNIENNIRITVNSNTFRIITVDKIKS